MTLSSEIAALTGDEDAATLRAIDARVAVLLGGGKVGENAGYYWLNGFPYKSPRFTTSLDPTLAEIRRRGWKIHADDDGEDYGCCFEVNAVQKRCFICRDDDNLALAALEALVRAVEGQG